MKITYLSLFMLCACQGTPAPSTDPSLEWLAGEALQLDENTDYQTLSELRFSSTPTDNHLRSLQHLPELTSLQIWDEGCFQAPSYPVGQMDDDTLALIAQLDQLESLSIAGWNVFYTDAGLKHLMNMPHLTSLKVCMAPELTDEGMRMVSQMPKLTHLDITYTHVTEAGLIHLLEAPMLENVTYGWTQTQKEHAIRFLEKHPQPAFLLRF